MARYDGEKLRVLVVWEPILPTDWSSPGRGALARISDPRARQFWDPQHLVARELSRIAREKSGQPQPDCCIKNDFHWDEAILYMPRAYWKDVPAPVFWNGPVYRILPSLEKALIAPR